MWRESFRSSSRASILSCVTEIPEHLLKRSRERRAAIGKGDGDGGDDAAPASSSTPATTAAAATPAAPVSSGPPARAAAAAPEPPAAPKPDPAYVTAAKVRRKVPWWAMATLGLMPVWGLMYVRSLTAAPVEAAGPLGEGAEIYNTCSSCHGG